jgi:hypothetical protein
MDRSPCIGCEKEFEIKTCAADCSKLMKWQEQKFLPSHLGGAQSGFLLPEDAAKYPARNSRGVRND